MSSTTVSASAPHCPVPLSQPPSQTDHPAVNLHNTQATGSTGKDHVGLFQSPHIKSTVTEIVTQYSAQLIPYFLLTVSGRGKTSGDDFTPAVLRIFLASSLPG
ncbi:hypothetical protein RRG08_028356 [Elysia crispata]|uniref:Uncharacterized protein n=1 Tax=Elysia crispata TaxID=231223 RepID=A0AAE1AWG2_9GAST|nr:hypothetical protein RRG08_028356 [Elysia crispata]